MLNIEDNLDYYYSLYKDSLASITNNELRKQLETFADAQLAFTKTAIATNQQLADMLRTQYVDYCKKTAE